MDKVRVFTILPSVARIVTLRQNFTLQRGRGLLVLLDITAVSGTLPTLDISLQYLLETTVPRVVTVAGALFVQKTVAGQDTLLVYPGITVTANRQVSSALGRDLSLLCTIGGTTPSFTFSVVGVEIP